MMTDEVSPPKLLPWFWSYLSTSGMAGRMHGPAEPVVRCAWNDAVLITRILDVGRSVLVLFVQNAEEARRTVAAIRHSGPAASRLRRARIFTARITPQF